MSARSMFGVLMNAYKVDRAMLEAHSSAEIRRILREERDDYTLEALQIFEEILAERGETLSSQAAAVTGAGSVDEKRTFFDPEEDLVQSPADARRVLDEVLRGVLDGSVEPQVGQAASSIVMTMLRAMELQYVSEVEEEACTNRSCRP